VRRRCPGLQRGVMRHPDWRSATRNATSPDPQRLGDSCPLRLLRVTLECIDEIGNLGRLVHQGPVPVSVLP